jgi:hypothetical protein
MAWVSCLQGKSPEKDIYFGRFMVSPDDYVPVSAVPTVGAPGGVGSSDASANAWHGLGRT